MLADRFAVPQVTQLGQGVGQTGDRRLGQACALGQFQVAEQTAVDLERPRDGLATGLSTTHVPYKDSGADIIDLASARSPIMISGLSPLVELHKAGQIRILAVSDDQRSPLVPEVPTLKEAGVNVSSTTSTGWSARLGWRPNQDFKDQVKARAYKAVDRNGVVWVCMGRRQDAPPPRPEVEATLLPTDEVDISFMQRDCNWMHAPEYDVRDLPWGTS